MERVDYSKASQYMSDENVVYHRLEEYFALSDGEYFRTGKDGEVEKSWYRIMVRYPERYEEHLYEAAHVRSKTEDEYKTRMSWKPGALCRTACSARTCWRTSCARSICTTPRWSR